MECGFSRHICSTVAKTIDVTKYAASFGAKNVQKTIFEAAEMMLGPWNQQIDQATTHAKLAHLDFIYKKSIELFRFFTSNSTPPFS